MNSAPGVSCSTCGAWIASSEITSDGLVRRRCTVCNHTTEVTAEAQARPGEVTCRACNKSNSASHMFCLGCGADLSSQPRPQPVPGAGRTMCPACSCEMSFGQRFCPRCGALVSGVTSAGPMPLPEPDFGRGVRTRTFSTRKLGFGCGLSAMLLVVILFFAMSPKTCGIRLEGSYDVAFDALNACPKAHRLLGEGVPGPAWVGCTTGQSKGNGSHTSASWNWPVAGSKTSGSYAIHASKDGGTWRLDSARLEVDGATVDVVACVKKSAK